MTQVSQVGFWLRIFCAVSMIVPQSVYARAANEAPRIPSHFGGDDRNTARIQIRGSSSSQVAFGVKVSRPKDIQVAAINREFDVFLTCNDKVEDFDFRIANVTKSCRSFHVLASDPIQIEFPYDPSALPEGVSDGEVRLFEVGRLAAAGPMAPIEAYTDIENKKTIATLREPIGQFINGVLKSGERPDRPPHSLSQDNLKKLREVDPVSRIPLIQPPQASQNGDLRLSYPLEFPGARDTIKPSVSIGYSAQSIGGDIAEGWSLSIPDIAVETRWGVPIYDPKFETETYIFNGEQLVPEAGDFFIDAQSGNSVFDTENTASDIQATDNKLASLNLVPQPHRTNYLRPRKSGRAHFVLRRDDGLWRFVRHGDNPSNYWWEAWQENPSGDTVKVLYFGNAPGRVPDDLGPFPVDELEILPVDTQSRQDVGSVTSIDASRPRPIIRWALAREKDAFGNLIDYDWLSSCVVGVNPAYSKCVEKDPKLSDRGLYLKRILYTGHEALEETLLRCRERPDADGCLRKQGMFEANFSWTANSPALDTLPLRSDARSGGLVVQRRLLERIDIRMRRRATSDQPGKSGSALPIQIAPWICSDAFAAHIFTTEPDPLFGAQDGARRWLSSITMLTPSGQTPVGNVVHKLDERAIFPAGQSTKCDEIKKVSPANSLSLVTRFGYKNPARTQNSPLEQAPFARNEYLIERPFDRPDMGDRLDAVASLFNLAGGSGIFSPSLLGSAETEETNGGIYTGIGSASKSLSVGYKQSFSRRSSHNETTTLLDVDGDGVLDFLISNRGQWRVHLGKLEADGKLIFGDGVDAGQSLPHGFRFQHEPVLNNQSSGFEAFAWGAMFGVSNGRSTAVQSVYTADMDGDGRIDVVTPGGVFYNISNTRGSPRALAFDPGTPFIGSGATKDGAATSDLIAKLQQTVQTQVESPAKLAQLHPLYDTVRLWRAPFTGHVLVNGSAAIVSADDALLDLPKSDKSPAIKNQPDARKDSRYQPRDGVILAIERSRGLTTDRCDASALSPGVFTKPTIPYPDMKGTWRLAGSLQVQEGKAASIFLTAAGLFTKTAAATETTSVKISLVDKAGAETLHDTLLASVTAAVAQWNAQPGRGGRLDVRGADSEVILRFTPDADRQAMAPLVVEMPIRTIGRRVSDLGFETRLDAITGEGFSAVASSAASLTTRLFNDRFEPAGSTCFTGGDEAKARAFAREAGLGGGLLADVKAGDTLYFRVHSSDDGSGDAVSWNPTVQYLKTQEPIAGTQQQATRTIFGYDPPTLLQDGLPVVAESCIGAPNEDPLGICAPLKAIAGVGDTSCATEIASRQLCDALGRNILHYQAAAHPDEETRKPGDLSPLANSDGLFVVPLSGKIRFTGDFRKPATLGRLTFEYVRRPYSEFLPANDNGEPACKPEALVGKGVALPLLQVNEANGEIIDANLIKKSMDPEGGRYRIKEPTDASTYIDVLEGDRICLFLRHIAPQDTDGVQPDSRMWPYDSASIASPLNQPVTVDYVRYARPSRVGSPVASGDDEEMRADASECGNVPAMTKASQRDVIQSGTAPNLTINCYAPKGAQVRLAFYAGPKAVDGIVRFQRLASREEPASVGAPTPTITVPVRADNARPAHASAINAALSPSYPSLACSWAPADPTLVERRFTLDVRTLFAHERLFNVTTDQNGNEIRTPVEYAQRIARLKTIALSRRPGQAVTSLSIRRFAVRPSQGPANDPYPHVEITARHLAGQLAFTLSGAAVTPSESLVYDRRGPMQSVSQNFHVIRGEAGTIALTDFDGDVPVDQNLHLPSAYVGLAVCAPVDADISFVSSIDEEDMASNAHTTRLLGTRACTPFNLVSNNPTQPAPDYEEAFTYKQGRLERAPYRICPIIHARVRMAVLDSPPTPAWTFRNQDLSVSFSPREPGEDLGPIGSADRQNSSRVASAFEPQAYRGSHVIAVRRDTSASDPGLLQPLPSLSQLLTSIGNQSPSKQQIEDAQKTLTQQPGCTAGDPAGPAEQTDFPDSDLAMCSTRQNNASSLVTNLVAYPLLGMYRQPRYTSGASSQRGQEPADVAPVATPFTGDQACAETPVSRRKLDGARALSAGGIETRGLILRALDARADNQVRAATGVDNRPPRVCQMGPDPSIFASADILSASRIGAKNVHEGATRALTEASVEASASLANRGRSAGLNGPPKVNMVTNRAVSASFFAGYSLSHSESLSRSEVLDMNGDGFPDIVANGEITFTDPFGGMRCATNGVWSASRLGWCPAGVTIGRDRVRESYSAGKNLSVSFPPSTPTYPKAVPSGNGSLGPSTSGGPKPEGTNTQQPKYGSLGLSLDLGSTDGNRLSELLDVNGDGLPDVVERAGNGYQVRLNLGYGFSAPFDFPAAGFFKDEGQSSGVGLSASFSTPDGAFGGGITANAGVSDQRRTVADINGDGLLDIVIRDGAGLSVSLGTGKGFTAPTPIGTGNIDQLSAIARTETDRASAGGMFNFSIMIWPLPPIFLHINPDLSISGALTRQPIAFRDFDGDGLPDLVVGEGFKDDEKPLGIRGPNFLNSKVTIHPNGFAQHGLLERVWLSTNPQSALVAPREDTANFEFAYSRAPKSARDPHHRWVLSRSIVRDGVKIDDATDVKNNARHTCFAYSDGFFDRFERRFLGYSRVDTIEGCMPEVAAPNIGSALDDWASRGAVRRVERHFANRTVYENGLLLAEKVFDLTNPIKDGGLILPQREMRQAHVLVDTALSSHARVVCFTPAGQALSGIDRNLIAAKFVRGYFSAGQPAGSPIDENAGPCREVFALQTAGADHADPFFENRPRRLTPALVQMVRETREAVSGPSNVLRTAVQYQVDHFARPVKVCDLAEISVTATEDEAATTRGAICAGITYDASVRPTFTHGATGGGTLIVEQRNRVKQLKVAHFRPAAASLTAAADAVGVSDVDPAGDTLFKPGAPDADARVLRRRTASYDPRTGTLSTLCQFAEPDKAVADHCREFEHFPNSMDRLEAAARAGVSMRGYDYDQFGNLARFLSPMGSQRTFTAKSYRYDSYLSLVETSEASDFCTPTAPSGYPPATTMSCLGGHSKLGTLISSATSIDYRHAAATTTIDVNRNATHIPLDPLGRPIAVFASWSKTGPTCLDARGCLMAGAQIQTGYKPIFEDKPPTFRQIARLSYHLADAHQGPGSTLERFTEPAVYRSTLGFSIEDGALVLPSRTLADHLGKAVQTIDPGDVCIRAANAGMDTGCDSVARLIASAIASKDRLDRTISDRYPSSVLGDINSIGLTGPSASDPKSQIRFDGLDRPVIVQMPDGGAYDFRYRVEPSLNEQFRGVLRHRVDSRNALCVPSATERDARGSIRTVIESYSPVEVDRRVSAGLGSAPLTRGDNIQAIQSGPFVAQVTSATATQQNVVCKNEAGVASERGQPFALGSRLSIAAHDRDPLGQLVAVNLPDREANLPHGQMSVGKPSKEKILAGYDGLGRRVLVDDPDRGFEKIHYDPLSNAVCRYSGDRRGTLETSEFTMADWSDVANGTCPTLKKAGKKGIFETDKRYTRVAATRYISSLPERSFFHDLTRKSPLDELRAVDIKYGSAGEFKDNLVARAVRTADVAGVETRAFDELGRPVRITREFRNLTALDTGAAQKPSLVTRESYDVWGLLRSKEFAILVPAYKGLGEPTNVDERVSYKYTVAGQIADVRGKSGQAPDHAVVANLQYDVRGNLLNMDFASGVASRMDYDERSNRLLTSRSRVDLAHPYIGPILFQNLAYEYDAAGNVLAYANAPRMSECTPTSVDDPCRITDGVAKSYGLLIRSSMNGFSYDQLNRVRTASKAIESVFRSRTDTEGEPQLMDDGEIGKSQPIRLAFAETFAFEPTHEMAVMRRDTQTMNWDAKKMTWATPTTQTVIANYQSDQKPRHAPGSITSRNAAGKETERTEFGFDEFGRMTASLCKRPNKEGCWPDSYFRWNVDDTMVGQLMEKRSEQLPYSYQSGKNKGIIPYAHIESEFDNTGRRVLKTVREQRIKVIKKVHQTISDAVQSDTLYAAPELTITRRPGQKPQALIHYFAGGQRVASKWIGDDQVFTYHAHLLTRNVTDIVTAKLDPAREPGSGMRIAARIHAQQEYAAFGEVLHERETVLAGSTDGQTSRKRIGLQHYRFNAKEQDETGLQDFGARFYHNRLALWMRPDPILHEYLDNEEGNSINNTTNMASYTFAGANPVSNVDSDGAETKIANNGHVIPAEGNSDRGIYRNGTRVGLSGFAGSHVSPETGKSIGWVHINVGAEKSFYAYTDFSKKRPAWHAAFHSLPRQLFDIKTQWVGFQGLKTSFDSVIFRGKYYTLRELGNIMAGYNAAQAGLTLDQTLKSAGLLQTIRDKKEDGPSKYHGEDAYSGKRTEFGWHLFHRDQRRNERESMVDPQQILRD